MTVKNKTRLDQLLVERALAPSREKAKRMILAGEVLVNDEPHTKAGVLVSSDVEIRVKTPEHAYVSRGGVKLAGALDQFAIGVKGRTALDVGASTGGFSDVLLQRGVTKIFAVDVGHNQLDWKIRNDPKVKVFEGVNARYLEFGLIGEKVDLIVMDVSFISVKKILPSLRAFAQDHTDWVILVKPQFEVGIEKVGKGGIVRSSKDQEEAVSDVISFGETHGLVSRGLIESPIKGTRGNREFFVHFHYASKK